MQGTSDRDGVRPCPRCWAVMLDGHRAVSRETQDHAAPLEICSRCREREALRDLRGWSTTPVRNWPLDVDVLLDEEHALLTAYRTSLMRVATISPDSAQRVLDAYTSAQTDEERSRLATRADAERTAGREESGPTSADQ